MADVQSAPQLPEYKSLEKVQGIPVVHDSLGYAHSVLSTNPYTSYVYNTGLGLSSTVFDYSKPIQARLAPLLVRADGIALQGINAVESRFPYPFQTPTEEVIGAVKASSGQAYDAFDSRVRTPAYGFAQSADKSLSPIVDKLELAVNKLSTQHPANGEESNEESQIGRAYRLSVQARDQIVLLSSEQIKQVQTHNVLVQRATDTIYKLNGSVQAFGKDTQARVQSASTGIMSELEKVQPFASSYILAHAPKYTHSFLHSSSMMNAPTRAATSSASNPPPSPPSISISSSRITPPLTIPPPPIISPSSSLLRPKDVSRSAPEQSPDVHQTPTTPTFSDTDRSESSHSGRRLRFAESHAPRVRRAEPDRTRARGAQGDVHQLYQRRSPIGSGAGTERDGSGGGGSAEWHTLGVIPEMEEVGAGSGVERDRVSNSSSSVSGGSTRRRPPNNVVPNRLLAVRRLASHVRTTTSSSSSSKLRQRDLNHQRIKKILRVVGLTVLSSIFVIYLALVLYFFPPPQPPPIPSDHHQPHQHHTPGYSSHSSSIPQRSTSP